MDRVSFTAEHDGDLVLPCDPLFTRLLALANHRTHRPAIRDVNTGVEKTAAELLSDALDLRRVLRTSLPIQVLKDLEDGKEVYVSLLASGGYEFTVGILAILCLGAAASPLSLAQPVNETTYYVNKAQSVAVLTSAPASPQGQALADKIKSTTNTDFLCIPIVSTTASGDISNPPQHIQISSSRYTSPSTPALLIFTSGTTGPPKAATLRHASLTDGALSFATQLNIKDTDTLLHLLPVHHATGIWVSFFPFLLSGACIEFRSGSFDAAWTWRRWQEGRLTYFTGVPTIYMRMMRYYQENILKLPADERIRHDEAAKKFKVCMCGTSALPKPIDDFWTSILGKRIVQRYGSTELGVVFNMPIENNECVPDGSVGEATLGVDVKLSEGDEGEILVRSFNMFSKYLHDEDATRKAHDGDGYFRSGDIARKEGKYYFIVGRASVDIIKSGGYKISALDVEREALALPYVHEVMVVGVPDDEFGQRVAAVVSLRTDEAARSFYVRHCRQAGELRIDDFRSDLRDRMAGYKLPTMLRVIREELPKTPSGKVVKKVLGLRYFAGSSRIDPEVQTWIRSPAKPKL